MAVVVRIIVNDPDPLDGVTGLPANAQDRFVYDPSTGLYTIELAPGEKFGRFMAGGLFGQSGSYVVKDVAVLSNGGAHADGSFVAIQGPDNPNAAGAVIRSVLPLGPTENELAEGTGLWPEGVNAQLPVGHSLVFDTQADGAAPGPHMIQFSLDPGVSLPFNPAISPFTGGGPGAPSLAADKPYLKSFYQDDPGSLGSGTYAESFPVPQNYGISLFRLNYLSVRWDFPFAAGERARIRLYRYRKTAEYGAFTYTQITDIFDAEDPLDWSWTYDISDRIRDFTLNPITDSIAVSNVYTAGGAPSARALRVDFGMVRAFA